MKKDIRMNGSGITLTKKNKGKKVQSSQKKGQMCRKDDV
jgi:hypothetical protein